MHEEWQKPGVARKYAAWEGMLGEQLPGTTESHAP